MKKGFYVGSAEFMPGISQFSNPVQMFTAVYRCDITTNGLDSKRLNDIYDEVINSLSYRYRNKTNCCITNLAFRNSLYDDDHAMVIITGCCLEFSNDSLVSSTLRNKSNPISITITADSTDNTTSSTSSSSLLSLNNKRSSNSKFKSFNDNYKYVEVTTLSYLPNARIVSYLGHINLFLIRESTQIKENGGLNGFMHCFISEMLALSRAHVLCLGGNAIVSFRMNECVLEDNPHKNQGQCLINIVGDAVKIIPK
jgi:hypothetical protein